MRRPRRLPAAALLLLLAWPAAACDPNLLDPPLEEAEYYLALALQANDPATAQALLRRVASTLAEVEMQAISCNCQATQAELSTAVAAARRAAAADSQDAMVAALEATLEGFQLSLFALDDDLCR